MKILTDQIARLLFAIPMAMFGLFHFLNAEAMLGFTPFGGIYMVYFTGIALIAAAISIIFQKHAYLASVLLGVFLLLTAILVHLPGGENSVPMLLKDIALAGGAFFMAGIFREKEAA